MRMLGYLESATIEAGIMILMLEDNLDRIERFTKSVDLIDSSLRLIIWRNANTMIKEVKIFLPVARLISLDHDLEPEIGEVEDPGDGYEVSKFLAVLRPICPVIIHSSNRTRSDWMIGEFDLGGWDTKRVAPIGDDWIESYWQVIAKDLLGKK